MDWIERYRIDPEFSKEYKEISKFIDNHAHDDKIVERRNAIISTILDEDFVDKLSYLNPVIDVLENTICRTLESPVGLVFFIDEDEPSKIGRVFPKSKSIQSMTMILKLDELIEKISGEDHVFPYLITEEPNGYIKFRGYFSKREPNIRWL